MERIGLMIGVITVFVIIIAVPLYFVLKAMDRRVKDGPRCRACGYDLRANLGEECVECGSKLSPKGVWPVGKPSRGPVIIWIVLWSWLMLVFTFSAFTLFQEYDTELIAKHSISTKMVDLYSYRSDQPYNAVEIVAYGSEWVLLPDSDYIQTDLQQMSIILLDENYVMAIATFNPHSRELEEPRDEFVKSLKSRHYHARKYPKANKLDTFLIEDMQNDPVMNVAVDKETLNEIDQLISLSVKLAEQYPELNTHNSIAEPSIISIAKDLQFKKVDHAFGHTVDVEFLPWWSSLFVLGAGFTAWLIGVPIIRKRIYRSMAVDAVPQT